MTWKPAEQTGRNANARVKAGPNRRPAPELLPAPTVRPRTRLLFEDELEGRWSAVMAAVALGRVDYGRFLTQSVGHQYERARARDPAPSGPSRSLRQNLLGSWFERNAFWRDIMFPKPNVVNLSRSLGSRGASNCTLVQGQDTFANVAVALCRPQR